MHLLLCVPARAFATALPIPFLDLVWCAVVPWCLLHRHVARVGHQTYPAHTHTGVRANRRQQQSAYTACLASVSILLLSFIVSPPEPSFMPKSLRLIFLALFYRTPLCTRLLTGAHHQAQHKTGACWLRVWHSCW